MRHYISTLRHIFPGRYQIIATLVIFLGICTATYAIAVSQGFFLRTTITGFDKELQELLLIQRGDTRSAFFLFFTYLGNWEIVAAVAAATIILMLLSQKIRAAYIFAITLITGQSLSLLFKSLLARSRPNNLQALISQGGHSFPSGHALGALIFYGMLAYFASRFIKSRWQRIVLSIGTILLIGLIGISRLYLGVHWFSDVIAGWIIGAALLILFIVFFEHRNELITISHRNPLVSKTTQIAATTILFITLISFIVGYYKNNPIT